MVDNEQRVRVEGSQSVFVKNERRVEVEGTHELVTRGRRIENVQGQAQLALSGSLDERVEGSRFERTEGDALRRTSGSATELVGSHETPASRSVRVEGNSQLSASGTNHLASDEELVNRLSGRRSCPDCGAVFNVHFTPPQAEGRCDRCGGELVHRADDQPETVRRRLVVYQEQTAPLIDWYEASEADLLRVDAERGVADVQGSFRAALGQS